NPPVDYSRTINYRLDFRRSEAFWSYFVSSPTIASTQLNIETGGVVDPEYPNSIQFNPIAEVDRNPDESRVMATYGNDPPALFRSTAPLPYFERPPLNIELIQDDGINPRTLIAHLPYPDPSRGAAHIFITI
ncbi:MAG: hypothetical protein AAFY91_18855, partial [Bacteroidota bacterium]